MQPNAETTIRPHVLQPVVRVVRCALVAVACIGLASCGGGPGGGRPALVVEDATVSAERPAAGERFTFSATVRNAGKGTAAASTLRVYRSDDATITTSDEQVGADTVPDLAAAASVAASVELTAPPSAGTYHYGACVDAVARESDTANGCSEAVRVTVPEAQDAAPASPGPDLVVESRSASADRPAAGERFTFSATVRNAGDENAPATTLRVYRSEDATITTSDEQVAAVTVPELAASETDAASVELAAPSNAGTYHYGACVDAAADESDTTNNCSAPVHVIVPEQQTPTPGSPTPGSPTPGSSPPGSSPPGSRPPDLEVASRRVSPESPAIGGVFRMHLTLRNAGEQTGGYWLRFYRSDDATFTESDSQVHRAWVISWLTRGTEEVSVHLDTPSTKGEHYYRACADAVPRESDTTNNCSTPVKIEVSHNKPDLLFHAVTRPVSRASPFKLGAEVWNVGGPSAATTLRFYHSTDRTITPSDTQVATVSVPALVKERPHHPSVFSRLVDVTEPTTAGVHYYGACVDAVTNESDTTNNCTSAFYTIRM